MNAQSPALTRPTGVSIGPRNRRRLLAGGTTVAAAVAVCAFALWFSGGLPFGHSSNHSESSTPAGRVITLIPQQPGLAYGMTKQQILHRLGKPEKIAGQCWQYPENIKNFVGGTFDAVRLCFYANQYQVWFLELNGLWRYSEGGTNDVIAPPTSIRSSPLPERSK